MAASAARSERIDACRKGRTIPPEAGRDAFLSLGCRAGDQALRAEDAKERREMPNTARPASIVSALASDSIGFSVTR